MIRNICQTSSVRRVAEKSCAGLELIANSSVVQPRCIRSFEKPQCHLFTSCAVAPQIATVITASAASSLSDDRCCRQHDRRIHNHIHVNVPVPKEMSSKQEAPLLANNTDRRHVNRKQRHKNKNKRNKNHKHTSQRKESRNKSKSSTTISTEWVAVTNIPPLSKIDDLLVDVERIMKTELSMGIVDLDLAEEMMNHSQINDSENNNNNIQQEQDQHQQQ